MKTKIELTKEQVDQIISTEEKQLRVKFEKDLASIRKKYEYIEIDLNHQIVPNVKQPEKTKITPELFNRYMSEGREVNEIASETGYNESYIKKLAKKFQLKIWSNDEGIILQNNGCGRIYMNESLSKLTNSPNFRWSMKQNAGVPFLCSKML